MDGGQGSLKVCLSVVDLDNPNAISNSVKDVFLLFVCFGVQENRHNIRKIWLLLRLDLIDFVLCVDLKMANIMCVLKTHSATCILLTFAVYC